VNVGIDPDLLPRSLRPVCDAIEVGVMHVDPRAFGAAGALEFPLVDSSGVHRETGAYWSSYVETGIYIRLDLSHPDVPAQLASELRVRHDDLVGTDGALYEHERATRSQHVNRSVAIARLAARVVAISGQ
jgi:hypothetical protein